MENMAIELKVPAVGESITEVEIADWLKSEGDLVKKDETIAIIDTEKTTVELPSPASGKLGKILKAKGEVASVGEVIAYLDPDDSVAAPNPPAKPAAAPSAEKAHSSTAPAAEDRGSPAPSPMPKSEPVPPPPPPTVSPAKSPEVVPTAQSEKPPASSPPPSEPVPARPTPPAVVEKPLSSGPNRREEIVRMTRLRRTVAERLVQAQHQAALLTTFNEIDMSEVMKLRKLYGEGFRERHGVKLGFMSFFVKAVITALKQVPQLNAEIRGNDIVYRHYFDIGVAIGGGKGLVVPVIRNAEHLDFAGVEKSIANFAVRVKEGKLAPDELEGGTFTITNGGVYGSLLSTPLVNPPQSGVLGMHAIQERPMAENGAVVIRPMMYVALTYDHRTVDGREAVTFLKRIKEIIESPARLLLEV